VKPKIRKFQFHGNGSLWYCAQTVKDWTGIGYSPADAYQDWKTLNKKDQTCEQSTE
jgi:hypothetical protein